MKVRRVEWEITMILWIAANADYSRNSFQLFNRLIFILYPMSTSATSGWSAKYSLSHVMTTRFLCRHSRSFLWFLSFPLQRNILSSLSTTHVMNHENLNLISLSTLVVSPHFNDPHFLSLVWNHTQKKKRERNLMSVAVINFYARNQVGMKSGDELKRIERCVKRSAQVSRTI